MREILSYKVLDEAIYFNLYQMSWWSKKLEVTIVTIDSEDCRKAGEYKVSLH